MTKFAIFVGMIALFYGVVCFWMYLRQNSFIYYPRPSDAMTRQLEKTMGFTPWIGPEGNPIGWKKENPESKEALLFFHGNGSLAIECNAIADKIQKSNPGSSIYLMEYPGYAEMPGKPSEKSIVDLGCKAVDALAASGKNKIYLIGQSLGTGVACEVGATSPNLVTGLILITPFDRLSSPGAWRYPYLPVKLLLREKYDSAANLEILNKPIAIVVAEQDAVIPAVFGTALYKNYTGAKSCLLVPGSGHNDITDHLSVEDFQKMFAFLKNPDAKTPTTAAVLVP
ncbi:MAG: alpha/beta hydrolase [Chthoniobacterales bacterium]